MLSRLLGTTTLEVCDTITCDMLLDKVCAVMECQNKCSLQ